MLGILMPSSSLEKSKKKTFNPFERVKKDEKYYTVVYSGVRSYLDVCSDNDSKSFDCHNYYNNEEFAKNQALRELLNRKLIKFSYENGGADIDNYADAYSIYYDSNHILCTNDCCPDLLSPMFISEEIAQKAIDEIVKPFMKEHPDFKRWG